VLSLAPHRRPHYPVLVHRLAPLLHASFRPRLATTVGIELGRADFQVEGYQSRPFGCEVGSQFHQGHASRGPLIIPDGRFSQIRFETLACLPWSLPNLARLKRWFAYASTSVVCPQPSSTSCVGSAPVLCPATALPMEPPSVQSPFAQCRSYLHGGDVPRLLRGRYSSVFAPTDSCANPAWLPSTSALASFEESSQLATSPCCQRDLAG
jgi:hypothetical protein